MEFKKRVEIVEVEYYDCGTPSHKHKKLIHAKRCYERKTERKLINRKFEFPKNVMYGVSGMILVGESFNSIAREFRISNLSVTVLMNQLICESRSKKYDTDKDVFKQQKKGTSIHSLQQDKDYWSKRFSRVLEYEHNAFPS